jgi:F-type H+-transporting ATPase subunit b
MRAHLRTFASATLALLASPLAAAEAGHGEGGGVTPFAGDVGNAIWTLLIFGLVVFVLGKFAWKPILGGLAAREKFIRDSLEEARRDRAEAEAKLKQYVDQLNHARSEATAIVEEARRDADEVKRRIQTEAQAESQRTVERARREIGLAKEAAVQELFQLSAKLTTEVAGRILRREISPADHEDLVRRSIDRLRAGVEARDAAGGEH